MRIRQVVAATLSFAWILTPLTAFPPRIAHGTAQLARPTGELQNGAVQDPDIEKVIAKHAAALRRVGPEARQGREDAVNQLLTLQDSRAHAVLHAYVSPGPDPDGVRRLVLAELPKRLRSPIDPAFGDPADPKQRKGCELRRRSYVAPLIQHFAAATPSTLISGSAEVSAQNRVKNHAAHLQRLAREVLTSMPTRDLYEVFQGMLITGPDARRAKVLRAGGQSRKLSVAPLFAPYLDNPALGDVAREALYALTYRRFDDPGAFASWQAVSGELTYTDLAEAAARRADEEVAARVSASHELHVGVVVELLDVLAASDRPDRWKRMQAQLFPSEASGLTPAMSAAVTRAGLEELAQVLAQRPVRDTDSVAERLGFYRALASRMAAPAEPADYALLLEVASYVCGPADAEPRQAQEQRLLRGLSGSQAVVRLAALRGMRRFFSPINRARVVQVVVEARRNRDLPTLTAAVATLKSPSWRAPTQEDRGFHSWVQGVQAVLTDASLPVELRQEAVSVLCLSDDKDGKVGRAFDLLLDLVGQDAIPGDLRQSVMLRLSALIPDAQPARDKASAQFVARLIELQSDAVAVEIRRAAAALLNVPPNVTENCRNQLSGEVVAKIGGRLQVETDVRVFRDLVRVLQSQAELPQMLSPVTSRLRSTLAALGGKPEAKELVGLATDGLRAVVLKKDRDVAEWTIACQALLQLRDRATIRNILDFHLRGGGRLAGEKEELVRRVWEVVIRTARLAPTDMNWSAKAHLGEAALVVEGVNALIRGGAFTKQSVAGGLPPLDDSRMRLTYLRCLAAIGKREELVKVATAWLKGGDKTLVNGERDAARLVLAEALLAEGKPTQAWTSSGIQVVQGPLLEPRLQLQSRIAEKLQADKHVEESVAVLKDALDRTAPQSQSYWPRFRAYLEYRFEFDAKLAGSLIQELDAWVAKRAKLTDAQQKEVAALKARLLGSASPQK